MSNWIEMKKELVKKGFLRSREDQFKELIAKGRVLKKVRNERLYKKDFGSFAAFVVNEFDITPQQAANLINASTICDSLEEGQEAPKTIKQCIKMYHEKYGKKNAGN